MISDGGRFMVERCWGAEKTLDGARMKAEMIEYIKAYETEVATLESANAGLTAELSALRAEKWAGGYYTTELYFDTETGLPWRSSVHDEVYCWLDGVPELPQPPEVQE